MDSTAPSRRARRRPAARSSLLALAVSLPLQSCAEPPDLVVYCALDQVHSEALLKRFERESGLAVRAEYDVEAHKTVGLVGRIYAERGRPRCDVLWNNEIAQTVRLAADGLLEPYDSPSAHDVPAALRDPERRWTGFAARARVFIVNTERADPARIHGLEDLLDPRWKGAACMAVPLTGTTLTHAAALYAVRGEEWTRDFLRRAQEAGVSFVQSNGQVMRLVREGRMAWGLTDTDDFNVARLAGHPVAAVYPDQEGPDALGTLLIPNTVAILHGAPHPDAARRLVDFLLSREVEAELAASESAQIPVREGVPAPAHVRRAGEIRAMAVDWAAVGADIGARAKELSERFLQ